MAPPKKILDEKLIRSLASIHCTMNEIATALGVSVDLLERRYADIIKEGRDHGKTSLRRYMWKAVTENGNIVMMIWLSKNLLGMSDKVEQTTQNVHLIEQAKAIGNMSKEELIRLTQKELERVKKIDE